MSAEVAASPTAPVLRWWRWFRNAAFWVPLADVFALLTALSLPWSTSLVSIFTACWLGAVAPTFDYRSYGQFLKRPIAFLPLAFFGLVAIGTLWSEAPWGERVYAVGPALKFLFIPALFFHFQRSSRGKWVLLAFLMSSALLMGLSWIVLFAPELKVTSTPSAGVPLKDYIAQSQEFGLCLFALAPLVLILFDRRRFVLAAVCVALMLGFFTNMMFVASARTALVYVPVLLVLFAAVYLSRCAAVLLFAVAAVTAVLVWSTSPHIRERVGQVAVEYRDYRVDNAASSTGLRLEFWRKSLRFFANAPLFGNGTGSTKRLFDRDAIGQSGVSAEVIGNPHNQTLNVAVQWGLLGCIVLYAMWFSHLLLFRGTSLEAWVGLLIVVQNMVSSLFNSHLFDFHEGWMYVLGVGVAGGMMLKARSGEASSRPGNPAQ
jgi:O-antigen ligase